MLPAKVLVMRHAEKLADPDDPNLSVPGQARAAALVAWYPATFGRPDFIFATAISKHSAPDPDGAAPGSEFGNSAQRDFFRSGLRRARQAPPVRPQIRRQVDPSLLAPRQHSGSPPRVGRHYGKLSRSMGFYRVRPRPRSRLRRRQTTGGRGDYRTVLISLPARHRASKPSAAGRHIETNVAGAECGQSLPA